MVLLFLLARMGFVVFACICRLGYAHSNVCNNKQTRTSLKKGKCQIASFNYGGVNATLLQA